MMKKSHIQSYLASALLPLLISFANHAQSATDFSFALIGDLPYGVKQGEKNKDYDKIVAQINSDESLEWVMHVGDIKTGGSSCSDEFLNDRKQRFDRLTPAFILTPGDNEWTDCHRIQAGNYDPLDRLDYLRKLFFNDHDKLKKVSDTFAIQSNEGGKLTEFKENLLWQKNNVTFSTIHIVGSLNGKVSFSLFSKFKRSKKYDQEIARRDNAAIHWLEKTFETAESTHSPGVFISIHANPGFLHGISRKEKAPYKAFQKKLYQLTKKYNKPVILAHGDTHTFQINKPELWKGKTPSNFIRVETFGDANGNWIKVIVEPNSPGVFAFMPVTN